MTVYVDSLFVLNLMIDYLILLSTAKISGAICSRVRLLIAAAAGACYSVAVFLPRCYFLSGVSGKILICVLMTVVAFGVSKKTFRLFLITLITSFIFAGGAMMLSLMGGNLLADVSVMYVPIDVKTLMLVAATVYAVISVVYKKTASRISRSLGDLSISVFGNSVNVKYLADTGNSLTDPMTNTPVTVVSREVYKKLTGDSGFDNDPVKLLERIMLLHPNAKTRLIPFGTVGGRGLMPAVKCDCASFDGKEIRGALVAFSTNEICGDGSYEAIAGYIGG